MKDEHSADQLLAREVKIVRETLAQLDGHADRVMGRFYDHLFERAPSLRSLFTNTSSDIQVQKFREMLYLIGDHLDDQPWIERTLARLGEQHVHYGVTADMYEPLEHAFVETLAEWFDARWTYDMDRAWRRAFKLIQRTMLASAPA
jgi:nitric oxide dioxygenase